ncbi:MAG: hypothetical protein A2928_03810 [Candidatus Taylorbacteria bacterium RIFCSPLOWO2_01_FULL_45_15b]|uniref:Ribulose-phosphate 3-epimerase n=1 Tax=Candidatus Taylorbacteria bacterium RIFCSPLOWO2_01_FULL_45_15b TaxID=1802319 RepID=A0A1G2NAJ4_9BACT|nr:MAG: hypothetical protein A2928_03810 [Candidatus Taylorbacteria bacterium RIFCSPLOWO2_01_FULL_45_15b]
MAEIIPAIIGENYEEVIHKIEMVKNFVALVQIDALDGRFTPTEAWPYDRGGYDPAFETILSEEEGLPFWEDLDFEIDLMVEDVERAATDWMHAGAAGLIFHIESKGDIKFIIEKIRKQFPKGDEGFPSELKIGVAIRPSTDIEALAPVIDFADFIQCMGSDSIGSQGVELDSRIYEKISALRKKYPDITISIDIGVNEDTAPKLVAAGANKLVAGSAIFSKDNPASTIEFFKSL